MAQVTMTIQDILMMYCWEADSNANTRKEIVEQAQKKLFSFDYPFYDPNLKDEFELQFIRHFYMREIGFESLALFKLKLEDYLHLNHDKWKRLYDALSKDFNPLYDYDLNLSRNENEDETTDNSIDEDVSENNTLEQDKKKDTTSNSIDDSTTNETGNINRTQNQTNFNRDLASTTPDERITISNDNVIEYADNVFESDGKNTDSEITGTTLEGTRHNESNNTQNQTELNTDTESKIKNRQQLDNEIRNLLKEVNERKQGLVGQKSYTQRVQEYVDNYQSINHQMFHDMNTLFLQLY